MEPYSKTFTYLALQYLSDMGQFIKLFNVCDPFASCNNPQVLKANTTVLPHKILEVKLTYLRTQLLSGEGELRTLNVCDFKSQTPFTTLE
jgi:hypothetical protein